MSHPYKKYLSKIRTAESSGDDYATNPHGAAGRYQFLPSTWTRMGYDIKDIYNPRLQEEAAQRFTDFNANYLRKRLGIEPTDTDLYGAHFLGAAGYSQLYKTPNNAPISTVMSSKEIAANPFVKGKTVGYVKNWLAKKMNQPGVEYDDTESSEPVYNPITPEQQAALDAYVAQATAMAQEKIAKENYKSELAKQELEQKQREQNFLNELNATFRNAKEKQEVSQMQQSQGDGSEYLLAEVQKPTLQTIQTPMVEYGKGGFVVVRSRERKGKTHKVTAPDGTVKYFGDSKLGQHPNDPKRKAAFYARHRKNLKNNPHFRAFARATWQDGGQWFGETMYKDTDYPPYENNEDYNLAMSGMMKSKMASQASLGNTGAKRMMSHNPESYNFTDSERDEYEIPSGSIGTHFMANLENYAYPLIQDRGDGKLYFNKNASKKDRESIEFQNPQEAEYFAKNYKKVAPMSKNKQF